MHLLLATSNPDKVREIRRILTDATLVLHTLAELPPVAEPEETGDTFIDNARLKARHYAAYAETCDVSWTRGLLTVAEDSGLVIDALDGEPGVRSARFLGPDVSYPERFAVILSRLRERPDRSRAARFVCAVAAVRAGDVLFETEGSVEGEIAEAPAGGAGFGYDPIFLLPDVGRTLAEVTDDDKRAVSHRGAAFRALEEWLAARGLDERH